jgi:DNA damage-inducible protein 1
METITQQQLDSLINGLSQVYKKTKQDQKEHLWYLAEEHICPMIYSKCTIHIDLKINGKIVRCFLDTGAQTNIISESAIQKYELESFVDRTSTGIVKGVGQAKINGIIPYIELEFENNSNLPANFHVMDNVVGHEILLGLPFMTFYQVKLDFEMRKASIAGKNFDLIIQEH